MSIGKMKKVEIFSAQDFAGTPPQIKKGGGSEFSHGTKRKDPSEKDESFNTGASDEARTRYLHLGKVALYQMSYTRSDKWYYSKRMKNVKS